jgi:toxin CptA
MSGRLEFRPRPSRILARFLLAVHVAAAISVIYGAPGHIGTAALLGFVVISYYWNYRRHILMIGGRSPRRVICKSDGSWYLQDRDGEVRAAELLPSSYLHPRLVILNFRLEKSRRRRNLVLCSDSLDVRSLRQLRQHLRVAAQGQSLDARVHEA